MKKVIQKIVLLFLVALSFSSAKAQQNQSAETLRLPLTVTASNNKAVLNDLTVKNFEIYLENKRAEIESFAQKNEPVSVGILIDTSASMRSDRNRERDRMAFSSASFSKFLENANPENDYFVMNFDEEVNIVLDTTRENEKVKNALAKISENKMNATRTAFYDAVRTAYEKIGKSKNEKKVLILITDAQDNDSSKLDFDDIKKLLKRENVLLYAIRVLPEEFPQYPLETLVSLQNIPLFERDFRKIRFLTDPFPTRLPKDSLKDLDELVSVTGGRIFFPMTRKETDDLFKMLADELKNQYDLIIKLPADFKKNDFNEIRIKFIGQKDKKVGKVTVRTRKGFYL